MGFSFSNDTIEKLKNQIDIVDIIGRSVSLKKKGANYKGLCPFHGEKTPSFVVSRDKQIFTCFGCGASGDAIEFVKRYYNLDFSEAIEKIAEEEGITLEKSRYNSSLDEYYRANSMAAKFFFNSFIKGPNKGFLYMSKRGMTPATIKKFGIGYADEEWDSLYKHLKNNGIEEKIMLSLGLISSSKGKIYDRFRNRVMFPIINTSGKVIGFGGRALDNDGGAKYINSPENPIFHKSNNMFALNFSRQSLRDKDYLIIVEGYMDAISLYQAGIENVAASLGTALTENHAKILKRYVKKVILSYDSDKAGRQAAYKAIDVLRKENLDVRVLNVDHGKDPDEYIKAFGKDRFLGLIEGATPGIDYQLEFKGQGYDLNVPEEKIAYFKEISDIFKLMSPIEKDLYSKKLGSRLNVSPMAILSQEVEETKNDRSFHEKSEEVIVDITPLEKTLIKIMIMNKDYIEKAREYSDLFKSDLGRELYRLLLLELESASDFVDDVKLKDRLDPRDAALLDEVLLNVNIVDEEDVFRDCIKSYKLDLLHRRQKQLIDLISMADEESENVEAMQRELIEIQKKIILQQGEAI